MRWLSFFFFYFLARFSLFFCVIVADVGCVCMCIWLFRTRAHTARYGNYERKKWLNHRIANLFESRQIRQKERLANGSIFINDLFIAFRVESHVYLYFNCIISVGPIIYSFFFLSFILLFFFVIAIVVVLLRSCNRPLCVAHFALNKSIGEMHEEWEKDRRRWREWDREQYTRFIFIF